MQNEKIIEESEEVRDLPSEILTQISATYPFLNKGEYDDYMTKAMQIESPNPIEEIYFLIKLLNNPHAAVREVMNNVNERSPEMLPSGEMLNSVLYLKAPSFSAVTVEDLDQAFKPFADASEGLIIDLRENGGGNSTPAFEFAKKHFILKGNHIFGTNTKIDPEGELAKYTATIESEVDPPYQKPIVILTSHKTFSSAERFVAAMKAGTNCTIMGEETRGGSANPIQEEIEYAGKRYMVLIPTWRFNLPGKEMPLEETKIKPDIPYNKDDIVDFASKYIRNFGNDSNGAQ